MALAHEKCRPLNSVRDRLGTAVTGDGTGHRDAFGRAAAQHAAGRMDEIGEGIRPGQVLLAGASIGLHYSRARAIGLSAVVN